MALPSAPPAQFNFAQFLIAANNSRKEKIALIDDTGNGIEDASKYSGLKFVAALNGACAGGGYELALACDDIVLVDDRSSAVSLPEVPLLGVLPGTGGLTRVTDKRHVRHDLADIFCTSVEGVRGQKAVDWRLVDAIAKPNQFQQVVRERADKLAAKSDRPATEKGVALTPIQRIIAADQISYTNVTVDIDRAKRLATFTVKAPTAAQPTDIAGILAAGLGNLRISTTARSSSECGT